MSKLKRFLTTGTWSDFGADETDSQYKNHKTNRASSFTSASSSRASKSSKRSNSEAARLVTELRRERRKTEELQEKLEIILGLNTEMRAAALSRVDEERRMRLMAEYKAKEIRGNLLQARKQLTTLESDKKQLEAELMEAARDLIAQRSYQKLFQERMEGESAAWEMLEKREEESAALEKRLKTSEAKRISLLKSLAGLKKESDQWGELCELLQEDGGEEEEAQRPPVALRSPRSSRSLSPSMPPIMEDTSEEHSAEESRPSPGAGNPPPSAGHREGLLNGFRDTELSFSPPPESSPQPDMFRPHLNGHPQATSPTTLQEKLFELDSLDHDIDELSLKGRDVDDLSLVSSTESLEIPEYAGHKTVGDYILTCP